MKLGVSLISLLSLLYHLALFRTFQTCIISKRKSQNPLIFGDHGFRLFFSFAEKFKKIPLCKLQICYEIRKIRKERQPMLHHLLRLIRAVLAEIIGTLLRKAVLA